MASASTPTRPASVAGHSLMQTDIRIVTPEEAASILTKNTRNRPVNATRVALFETYLRNGEMQLTHQGVAISSSNVLLDGQHRLIAIVNTGIPAKLMITTGLPDSVFSVLDTGAKRTAGDILGINGAVQCSTMAAGIRLYILYQRIPELMWNGQNASQIARTTSISKVYNDDKDGWTHAATIARANRLTKIITPGPMSCLIYLAMDFEYSLQYLEEFLFKLKSGYDLCMYNPILAYRNKMINSGELRQQEKLADYIKLFNAYTTGQQLKIFKSQQYPPMPSLVHASESIHKGAQA